MSRVIVLAEDRIIDGIPRVKGEVVRTSEDMPTTAIKRVLVSEVEQMVRTKALAESIATAVSAQIAKDKAEKPVDPPKDVKP